MISPEQSGDIKKNYCGHKIELFLDNLGNQELDNLRDHKHILYYISLPDYLVFNSMSFSNGANRDTELQVIVYQYWNTDEVIAEIEAEHNQINGTPTILTINLYHSKWSFRNGYEPFYSTTINYN